MANLTHFNETGEAHVVDVGAKDATHRVAVAEGRLSMRDSTHRLDHGRRAQKGGRAWASPG